MRLNIFFFFLEFFLQILCVVLEVVRVHSFRFYSRKPFLPEQHLVVFFLIVVEETDHVVQSRIGVQYGMDLSKGRELVGKVNDISQIFTVSGIAHLVIAIGSVEIIQQFIKLCIGDRVAESFNTIKNAA